MTGPSKGTVSIAHREPFPKTLRNGPRKSFGVITAGLLSPERRLSAACTLVHQGNGLKQDALALIDAILHGKPTRRAAWVLYA
jgi:hypothetical protein